MVRQLSTSAVTVRAAVASTKPTVELTTSHPRSFHVRGSVVTVRTNDSHESSAGLRYSARIGRRRYQPTVRRATSAGHRNFNAVASQTRAPMTSTSSDALTDTPVTHTANSTTLVANTTSR